MSATVDERIVAAKFDASDFEKGVSKTIKKLDELKKSLNFKDTTKSVNELSEKVKSSTDSMSGSLEKLSNRLTTFVGMIKQNILSGLAQEVSDVFLKMERSVTNFVRSLGSEQVSAGMAKYEQMLSSVRTMMAAGESQDSAYTYIEQLRDYSDQTSYSLSQMTDALSKFRAAGVGLEEATRSVEGIANACATAGVNAIDAQRAFYNLSQAYSSGSLKYTDYRSLELLNMTTEKFKENLLEAAEEAGTLKRLADGTYKTIAVKGEKITKGKQVTVKNIQEALKYGFVTKNVMNKLFGGKYYFTEKEFRNYKKKYTDEHGNLTEAGRQKAIADAKRDFNEYAVDAYLAAREARNFTDVINTLKDVVSTGWSTTFEYLFGKLEDATKFFTKLAEGPLADVIYKIGEYRNAILGFWNGVGTDYEGSGAKMIQDIILNISDALGTLFKTFQQILPGFEELDYEEGKAQPQLEALGNKLRAFTAEVAAASLRIKQGVEAFNEWMNSPIFDEKGGATRIEVIRQAISNFLSVFSIGYKLFEFGFNTIVKVITKAQPVFDAIFTALEKIGEPLAKLDDNKKPFEDLENTANNLLTALDPIIKGLTAVLGIVGEVGKFFAGLAIDSVTTSIEVFSDVLGFFIDLFTGGETSESLKEGKTTLEGIKEAFNGIKEACSSGLNAIKEFMGSLIKDLRKLFGLVDENGEEIQNGGVFENLKNFFNNNQFLKDAKAWVDQAITDVSNFIKDIPNKIVKLGANVYDTLYGLFFKEETKYNGSMLETKTVLTPLGEWMSNVITDVKNFFINLPANIIAGVGKVFGWVNTLFDAWFGNPEKGKSEEKGKQDAKKENGEVTSRFDAFIKQITDSVKEWFDDMPNKIRKGLSSIGNFMKKLFNVIDEFLFGKKVTKHIHYFDAEGNDRKEAVTVRIKSGFSKWLDGFIKEIKKFIKKIPEYLKEGIKGVGDIVTTIVDALFGKDEGSNTDPSKKIEEQIKKPFLGIDWTSIWNTVKEVGITLINQVARIFTGTDNVEVNAEWFSNTVAQGIDWIRTKAISAFGEVEKFIKSIPGKIAEWFTGEGDGTTKQSQEQGPVGQALSRFASSVGQFIANIPSEVMEFVDEAILAFGTIWDNLYTSITNTTKEKTAYAENELGYPASYAHNRTGEKTAWDNFVEKLGTTISDAFALLPTFVADGVHLALLGINSAIEEIGNWFTGEESAQVQENSKTSTERAMGKVADGVDEGQNASKTKLQIAFDNIGETIKTLITKTIPEFIGKAWASLSALGSQIWEGIEAVFDDTKTVDGETSPVAKAVETFGENVKKKITGEDGSKGLVGWINDAFTYIVGQGQSIWTGIQNIFEGHPQGAFQTAISEFGTWMGGLISVEIPNAINTAFTSIGKLFQNKDKDPVEESLALLPESEQAYYRRYIDSLRKSGKKVEQETEQPGFWSFIDTIGENLGKAFISIGPSILNGISTALEWITHIGDIIIDLLSGKTDIGTEIEKAYGAEAKPLKESLTRVGENIKKLLVETLPRLIGTALAEITEYTSVAFTNLTGGFEDAADENAKGVAKVFDVKDKDSFFGKIFGYFDMIVNMASGGTGESIAIIIAVAYLLKNLKEAMSITDELEAAAGTMKWTAITIAILGLTRIISSIMDIINTGDETKIEHAEKIMEKLGSMLETVAWIIGLMSAGKVASALSELFGGKNGTIGNIKVNAKNSKDAMVNVQNIINTVTETSSWFTKGLTAATTGGGIGLGAVAAGAGIKVAIEDTIDGLTTAFNELLTSVDTAMDVLSPFISKLTDAGDKVDNAKKAVDNIIDLFKQMFEKFASLYESIGGEEIKEITANAAAGYATRNGEGDAIHGHTKAYTSIMAFVSDFSSVIDVYISISQFIDSLADALNKLGNIDSIDTRIDKLTEIVTSEAFSTLIQKVYSNMYDLSNRLKNSGIDGSVYSNLSETFSVLADVMKIISESMGMMDADTSKNFNEGFAVLEKLADVFDGSDKSLLKVGSRMATFGANMRRFYDYVSEIKGFDAADAEATSAKVSSMMEVIKAASSSAKDMSYYGEGFKFLPTLGSYLPDLGQNFAGFVEQLNRAFSSEDGALKNISDDRLNVISSITSSISMLLSSFGELGYLTQYSGIDFNTYEKVLDGIYTNLQNLIDNPRYNKFAGVAAQLYKIINDPLTSEDAYEKYHSAGADIAKELYAGIQAALDNPDNHYQPEITPVIKTDAIRSQLDDYFLNGGFTPQINAESVIGLNSQTDAKLDGIKATLDAINENITSLNSNVATTADVSKAIGGWKIVTNTGKLVGEMTPAIDRAIGERMWLVLRKNTID